MRIASASSKVLGAWANAFSHGLPVIVVGSKTFPNFSQLNGLDTSTPRRYLQANVVN